MSFKVSTTAEFESDAKILQKRHRSFKNDLKDLIISLEENPFQGVELSPGIRKIRMAIASKGRGKSGGARVITYTVIAAEMEGKVSKVGTRTLSGAGLALMAAEIAWCMW